MIAVRHYMSGRGERCAKRYYGVKDDNDFREEEEEEAFKII